MSAHPNSPRASLGPTWHQCVGLWRARGANPTAIRLGMGLAVGEPTYACDREGFTLWHYWAESPHPDVAWAIMAERLAECRDLRSFNGEHPWHRLALRGHGQATLEWAKTFGAPTPFVTNDGDTFLHRAAWSGDDQTVQTILTFTPPEQLNWRDQAGLTPLVVALHRLGEKTVQAMVHAGADPNITDEQGRSALHHAALYGDPALVMSLESGGGDADAPDSHGETANGLLAERREQSEHLGRRLREHWRRRYHARAAF